MKKISSVLLAFLMLVSSLFCANAAFGEDGSGKNGKNAFQSAENLVIGTIYNRPATEITGTVFKLDLNQAAKYTLSISSNSAAKVEIYQNDDKNIIIEEKDGLYIYGNPWSGKSLIDINTKVKLTNLVFVHRNTSPSVREVTKKEEFLYLMPHITNSSFMYNREKWNQLTNKLIEINACVLNCNISYDSVDALKQYLEETK